MKKDGQSTSGVSGGDTVKGETVQLSADPTVDQAAGPTQPKTDNQPPA